MKKARNKKHNPRGACHAPALIFTLPMNRKEHDTLAMQMHMQVDSFILAPSTETGETLSYTMTIISRAIELQSPMPLDQRKDSDALTICLVGAALNAVMDRFDRVQRWGVNAGEAETLRLCAGVLDGTIGRMPPVLILAATDVTNQERAATWASIRKERAGQIAAETPLTIELKEAA